MPPKSTLATTSTRRTSRTRKSTTIQDTYDSENELNEISDFSENFHFFSQKISQNDKNEKKSQNLEFQSSQLPQTPPKIPSKVPPVSTRKSVVRRQSRVNQLLEKYNIENEKNEQLSENQLFSDDEEEKKFTEEKVKKNTKNLKNDFHDEIKPTRRTTRSVSRTRNNNKNTQESDNSDEEILSKNTNKKMTNSEKNFPEKSEKNAKEKKVAEKSAKNKKSEPEHDFESFETNTNPLYLPFDLSDVDTNEMIDKKQKKKNSKKNSQEEKKTSVQKTKKGEKVIEDESEYQDVYLGIINQPTFFNPNAGHTDCESNLEQIDDKKNYGEKKNSFEKTSKKKNSKNSSKNGLDEDEIVSISHLSPQKHTESTNRSINSSLSPQNSSKNQLQNSQNIHHNNPLEEKKNPQEKHDFQNFQFSHHHHQQFRFSKGCLSGCKTMTKVTITSLSFFFAFLMFQLIFILNNFSKGENSTPNNISENQNENFSFMKFFSFLFFYKNENFSSPFSEQNSMSIAVTLILLNLALLALYFPMHLLLPVAQKKKNSKKDEKNSKKTEKKEKSEKKSRKADSSHGARSRSRSKSFKPIRSRHSSILSTQSFEKNPLEKSEKKSKEKNDFFDENSEQNPSQLFKEKFREELTSPLKNPLPLLVNTVSSLFSPTKSSNNSHLEEKNQKIDTNSEKKSEKNNFSENILSKEDLDDQVDYYLRSNQYNVQEWNQMMAENAQKTEKKAENFLLSIFSSIQAFFSDEQHEKNQKQSKKRDFFDKNQENDDFDTSVPSPLDEHYRMDEFSPLKSELHQKNHREEKKFSEENEKNEKMDLFIKSPTKTPKNVFQVFATTSTQHDTSVDDLLENLFDIAEESSDFVGVKYENKKSPPKETKSSEEKNDFQKIQQNDEKMEKNQQSDDDFYVQTMEDLYAMFPDIAAMGQNEANTSSQESEIFDKKSSKKNHDGEKNSTKEKVVEKKTSPNSGNIPSTLVREVSKIEHIQYTPKKRQNTGVEQHLLEENSDFELSPKSAKLKKNTEEKEHFLHIIDQDTFAVTDQSCNNTTDYTDFESTNQTGRRQRNNSRTRNSVKNNQDDEILGVFQEKREKNVKNVKNAKKQGEYDMDAIAAKYQTHSDSPNFQKSQKNQKNHKHDQNVEKNVEKSVEKNVEKKHPVIPPLALYISSLFDLSDDEDCIEYEGSAEIYEENDDFDETFEKNQKKIEKNQKNHTDEKNDMSPRYEPPMSSKYSRNSMENEEQELNKIAKKNHFFLAILFFLFRFLFKIVLFPFKIFLKIYTKIRLFVLVPIVLFLMYLIIIPIGSFILGLFYAQSSQDSVQNDEKSEEKNPKNQKLEKKSEKKSYFQNDFITDADESEQEAMTKPQSLSRRSSRSRPNTQKSSKFTEENSDSDVSENPKNFNKSEKKIKISEENDDSEDSENDDENNQFSLQEWNNDINISSNSIQSYQNYLDSYKIDLFLMKKMVQISPKNPLEKKHSTPQKSQKMFFSPTSTTWSTFKTCLKTTALFLFACFFATGFLHHTSLTSFFHNLSSLKPIYFFLHFLFSKNFILPFHAQSITSNLIEFFETSLLLFFTINITFYVIFTELFSHWYFFSNFSLKKDHKNETNQKTEKIEKGTNISEENNIFVEKCSKMLQFPLKSPLTFRTVAYGILFLFFFHFFLVSPFFSHLFQNSNFPSQNSQLSSISPSLSIPIFDKISTQLPLYQRFAMTLTLHLSHVIVTSYFAFYIFLFFSLLFIIFILPYISILSTHLSNIFFLKSRAKNSQTQRQNQNNNNSDDSEQNDEKKVEKTQKTRKILGFFPIPRTLSQLVQFNQLFQTITMGLGLIFFSLIIFSVLTIIFFIPTSTLSTYNQTLQYTLPNHITHSLLAPANTPEFSTIYGQTSQFFDLQKNENFHFSKNQQNEKNEKIQQKEQQQFLPTNSFIGSPILQREVFLFNIFQLNSVFTRCFLAILAIFSLLLLIFRHLFNFLTTTTSHQVQLATAITLQYDCSDISDEYDDEIDGDDESNEQFQKSQKLSKNKKNTEELSNNQNLVETVSPSSQFSQTTDEIPQSIPFFLTMVCLWLRTSIFNFFYFPLFSSFFPIFLSLPYLVTISPLHNIPTEILTQIPTPSIPSTHHILSTLFPFSKISLNFLQNNDLFFENQKNSFDFSVFSPTIPLSLQTFQGLPLLLLIGTIFISILFLLPHIFIAFCTLFSTCKEIIFEKNQKSEKKIAEKKSFFYFLRFSDSKQHYSAMMMNGIEYQIPQLLKVTDNVDSTEDNTQQDETVFPKNQKNPKKIDKNQNTSLLSFDNVISSTTSIETLRYTIFPTLFYLFLLFIQQFLFVFLIFIFSDFSFKLPLFYLVTQLFWFIYHSSPYWDTIGLPW